MAGPYDRPLPTGLDTAPLAPRRTLRNGSKSSTSGSSGSRAGSSVGASAGRGRVSRSVSQASSRAGSRMGTPIIGGGSGRVAAGSSSSSAQAGNPVNGNDSGASSSSRRLVSLSPPPAESGAMMPFNNLGWRVRDEPQPSYDPPTSVNPASVAPALTEEHDDRAHSLEYSPPSPPFMSTPSRSSSPYEIPTYSPGAYRIDGRHVGPDVDTAASPPFPVSPPYDFVADIDNIQNERAQRQQQRQRQAAGGPAGLSARSPSPALSVGSRSPSPALPLPLAISARQALGGLGRVAAEQAEVDGQLVPASPPFPSRPEQALAQNPREDSPIMYSADSPPWMPARSLSPHENARLDGDIHGHGLNAINPALLTRAGFTQPARVAQGSSLLDRLGGWDSSANRPIAPLSAGNSSSGNTPTSTTTGSSGAPVRPFITPTSNESGSGSGSSEGIEMLDSPPAHLASSTRPGRTPAVAHLSQGSNTSASSSRAVSDLDGEAEAGSSSSSSGGAGAVEGERRFTREEKGKGRAAPVPTNAARSLRPRRRQRDEVVQVDDSNVGDADIEMEDASAPIARRGTEFMDGDDLTDIDDGEDGDQPQLNAADESVQWMDAPSTLTPGEPDEHADDKAQQARMRKGHGQNQKEHEHKAMRVQTDVKEEIDVDAQDDEVQLEEHELSEEAKLNALPGLDRIECPICSDSFQKPVLMLCGHVMCQVCLWRSLVTSKKNAATAGGGAQAIMGLGGLGGAIIAGRGRHAAYLLQRGGGRGGRGGRGGGATGGRGKGAKRARPGAPVVEDPTVPPVDALECQPTEWTAPQLARALREHRLKKELQTYKDTGMSTADAQAALDAVHADDPPILDEPASNARAYAEMYLGLGGHAHMHGHRQEEDAPGVKMISPGVWKIEGGHVVEGACPLCRMAIPGGMGPFDSGVGSVIPLSALVVDRPTGRKRVKA